MKIVLKFISMSVVIGFMFAVASCVAGPDRVTTTWTSPADDTTWTSVPEGAAGSGVDLPAPTIDLGEIARGTYLDTVRPLSPRVTEAEWLDFAGIACASLDQHGQDMMAAVEQTTGQRAALTLDMASAVTGAVMGSFYCEHYFTAGG